LRDEVEVVSLSTMSVERSIPVGNEPVALALNPSSTILYVGHAAERTIRAIDLASWAQVGNFSTPFLTWDLVAPTDGQLIATTHDPAYTGEYPYVVNSTDGSVLQRLDPGELVYMDFLVAVNSTGTLAFLVTSALAPFVMFSFERDSSGTWTFQGRGPDFGPGAPAASDIIVSPDDGWVYATLASGIVEGIAVNGLGSGPIGLGSTSHTADASPTGEFVVSAGDATVRIYDVSPATDPGGFHGFPVDPVATIALSDQPWHLRISPRGEWIVAIVGITADAWQDLEIIAAPALTDVRGIAPQPFTKDLVVDVSARVVDFRSLADFSVVVLLDGMAIPGSFDPASGLVVARVGPLAELDHDVQVRAVRGTEVTEARWTFVVDATPPVLQVDPIPSVVESDALVISGTVVDLHLVWVRVGSSFLTDVTDSRFSVSVRLDVGSNSFEIEALDGAGNVAQTVVRTEFRPPVRWFVHPDGHFQIQIPWGWSAEGNVTLGNTTFDVLLSQPSRPELVSVSRHALAPSGGDDARQILNNMISDARLEAQVEIFEPVADTSVDGHPAARTVIALTRIGLPQIFEVVTVVVGTEWGLSWILIGAAPVGVFQDSRPEIESTMLTFDIFGSGPLEIANLGLRILAGGSVAAVLGGIILVAFVQDRRRQRPLRP